MARPRLDDEERRARTVGVRVTATEAAELRERAQAERLSMGAYLRRRALGQRVRMAAELRRWGLWGEWPTRELRTYFGGLARSSRSKAGLASRSREANSTLAISVSRRLSAIWAAARRCISPMAFCRSYESSGTR